MSSRTKVYTRGIKAEEDYYIAIHIKKYAISRQYIVAVLDLLIIIISDEELEEEV
jgi:hypothetical protein